MGGGIGEAARGLDGKMTGVPTGFHDLDALTLTINAEFDAPRARIWQVMAEQFGLAVDDAVIEALAGLFPEASGRDIKGLAKLTAKYCSQKGLPPTIEAFQRCSIFRGMDMAQRQEAA